VLVLSEDSAATAQVDRVSHRKVQEQRAIARLVAKEGLDPRGIVRARWLLLR
jgi:hypothetical protein